MLVYSDFVDKILRRLNPKMPVLVERDGHFVSPIYFELNKLFPDADDGFYQIRNDETKIVTEFLQESLDEELFPDDMWMENHRCKSDYIEDWMQDEFDYPYSFSVYEGADLNTLKQFGIQKIDEIPFGLGDTNCKVFEIGELIKIYEEAPNNLPLFFPYDDHGVGYFTTFLEGIGINRRTFALGSNTIEKGSALIINLNNKLKRNKWEEEICDFSLYRNLANNPWPKKYSRDLYNSLIYERRKTNEKA